LQFNIVPAGSNSVLAYVDQDGAADVVNLDAGVVIGSQNQSTSPTWANSSNSYPPIINYFVSLNIDGLMQDEFGPFVGNVGFIGLKFWVKNQSYYGFLQLDCRFSFPYGGLYQGYAWNTTSGESITTSYFRNTLAVPEYSTTITSTASNCAAIKWTSQIGHWYQVQSRTNIVYGSWNSFSGEMNATTTNSEFVVSTARPSIQFYRIVQVR
jgi:hypothetical protein